MIYLAEYNFAQKEFHIEPLEGMRINNMPMFKHANEIELENCWIPFDYGTQEECLKAINYAKELMQGKKTNQFNFD